MTILKYSQLPPDGFAGVRMREIVKDSRLFGAHGGAPHAEGIGRLVYIADARFVPFGDTRMHAHSEIDIVTLVLKGRLSHQGSLGDGQLFGAYEVQIQRAGGTGLMHNERNPDPENNHVIQIWLLPEQRNARPEYRVFKAMPGSVTRVYGGVPPMPGVIQASTTVDIVRLREGEVFETRGPVNLYLGEGSVRVDDYEAQAGDFIETSSPRCEGVSESVLMVIGQVQGIRAPQ